MGRSNYAILAMGLASMLVLSLLMKYFLRQADERAPAPVIRELNAVFGDRVDVDSQLAFEKTADGRRAVLTIHPLLGASVETLAREMGQFVWRRAGDDMQLTGVVVDVRSWSRPEAQRIDVPRPYITRRPAVEPAMRPAPAGGSPAGARGASAPPRTAPPPAPR